MKEWQSKKTLKNCWKICGKKKQFAKAANIFTALCNQTHVKLAEQTET